MGDKAIRLCQWNYLISHAFLFDQISIKFSNNYYKKLQQQQQQQQTTMV
jgi:hypothetical protein